MLHRFLLAIFPLTAAQEDGCWEEIHAGRCCPMADDTHSCFDEVFTFSRCCTASGPVLAGCNCTSLYLQEVAAFLKQLPRTSIEKADVDLWQWRYHPPECSDEIFATALDNAKNQSMCSQLEKLHFVVLCSLQRRWWKDYISASSLESLYRFAFLS